MHLHNSKENIAFLKEHLPGQYVKKTLEKLEWEIDEKNIQKVRNVRYGISRDNTIMLALVEIANENKKAAEAVQEIINN